MNLKRTLSIFVIFAVFTAGIAVKDAKGQGAPQRKARIAVLDFDYGTVESASAAIFGTNVDIGKGITNLLVTNLVKDGTYSIIERAALDKILAEQNFSNSNRADATSAARLGKILGVDYIVLGTITEFGAEKKSQNVGGGGGNWHGFGLGGVGHSNSAANVGITARVINIDTAEILATADGKGTSSRSGLSLLGGGGNWSGFGRGNVDFGSSNFQNTIIGEATKKAVDQLSAGLVGSAGRMPVRTFKGEGIIAAVDGGQIILNVGLKAGIHSGDSLDVLRIGKEIKDPSTGQVIRRLTTTVGTIRATDVDDASAICAPVSGSGFQVGDRVNFETTASPTSSAMAAPSSSAMAGATAPAAAAEPRPAPYSAPAPAAAASDTGSSAQPNFSAIKADFVPGEKPLLMDDFSDMVGDEPPPHWKIRGATPELRVAGNIRELALLGNQFDIYPNITALPKNFTMEMDLWCEKPNDGGGGGDVHWYFQDKGRNELLHIWAIVDSMKQWRIHVNSDKETLGDKTVDADWSQPLKLALWVQNGRVRLYLNGDRIFDSNQVEIAAIESVQMNFWTRDAVFALRRARFAECTPDFGQTIASSGKFVTHGILFDTDSDRIKPESAAVIQTIARGLVQNPDLKVEIDGHTDSTGAADHNMDLSKRRAEAVKTVLVAQFSVDASRLTTTGFGASKPVDNNGTPQGKANNRRVEFVKK